MKNFPCILSLAVTSLIGVVAAPAAPVPMNSPVGDWDFVATGQQRGVAFITFHDDSTLLGTEILWPTPTTAVPAPKPDPRNPSGASGRDGATPPGTTNSTITRTNFIGGAILSGMWTFDDCGRVIGFLNELTSILTNITVLTTNVVDDEEVVTTNTGLAQITVTNGGSFRAIVSRPGTAAARITLATYNLRGRTVLRGVPQAELADLTGTYAATGRRPDVFVEFFEMTPDPFFANKYIISDGSGAAYTFTGRALLSRQKQIALYTYTESETPVLSAYSGPFNSIRRNGRVFGSDGVREKIKYAITPRP